VSPKYERPFLVEPTGRWLTRSPSVRERASRRARGNFLIAASRVGRRQGKAGRIELRTMPANVGGLMVSRLVCRPMAFRSPVFGKRNPYNDRHVKMTTPAARRQARHFQIRRIPRSNLGVSNTTTLASLRQRGLHLVPDPDRDISSWGLRALDIVQITNGRAALAGFEGRVDAKKSATKRWRDRGTLEPQFHTIGWPCKRRPRCLPQHSAERALLETEACEIFTTDLMACQRIVSCRLSASAMIETIGDAAAVSRQGRSLHRCNQKCRRRGQTILPA